MQADFVCHVFFLISTAPSCFLINTEKIKKAKLNPKITEVEKPYKEGDYSIHSAWGGSVSPAWL